MGGIIQEAGIVCITSPVAPRFSGATTLATVARRLDTQVPLLLFLWFHLLCVLQSTIRCTRCWISLDSWCVGQRYLWVMVVLLGVDWKGEKRPRKCLIYHHDADFIKPICTPWIKQGYPQELPIDHQKVGSLRLLQWERVIWREVSKRISQEVRWLTKNCQVWWEFKWTYFVFKCTSFSSVGKESTCNAGDLVRYLGREDPLEKE